MITQPHRVVWRLSEIVKHRAQGLKLRIFLIFSITTFTMFIIIFPKLVVSVSQFHTHSMFYHLIHSTLEELAFSVFSFLRFNFLKCEVIMKWANLGCIFMYKNKYIKVGPICDDQIKVNLGSHWCDSYLSACMGFFIHSLYIRGGMGKPSGGVPSEK